jgi:hypothetical protein
VQVSKQNRLMTSMTQQKDYNYTDITYLNSLGLLLSF